MLSSLTLVSKLFLIVLAVNHTPNTCKSFMTTTKSLFMDIATYIGIKDSELELRHCCCLLS